MRILRPRGFRCLCVLPTLWQAALRNSICDRPTGCSGARRGGEQMNRKLANPSVHARLGQRVHGLSEITVLYEGCQEQIVVKPPDLSARGMFISTSQTFPEG